MVMSTAHSRPVSVGQIRFPCPLVHLSHRGFDHRELASFAIVGDARRHEKLCLSILLLTRTHA